MANFTDEQIAEILDAVNRTKHTQYIGSRYVPLMGRKGESSIIWDNSKPYEPLTIVLHQGNSYTSRQYVPAEIDINNNDYWANTGNYNAQIEQYRQEVATYNNRINANTNSAKNANDKLSAIGVDSTTDGTNLLNRINTINSDSTLNKELFNALEITNTQQAVTFKNKVNTTSAQDEMLCFGDSWTFGYGVNPTERWTTIVANKLNLIEHNYAVSGAGYVFMRNDANFITEINNAITDTTVNKDKVKYITLMGGINDLNANRVTPQQMIEGVKQCIEKIIKNWPHAKIIVSNINDNRGYYFGNIAMDASQKMSDLQYDYPITLIPNPNIAIMVNHTKMFNNTTGHPSVNGHIWLAQTFIAAMTGAPLPSIGKAKQPITMFENFNGNTANSFTGEKTVIYSVGGETYLSCQLTGECTFDGNLQDIIIGTLGNTYAQDPPFTAPCGALPSINNFLQSNATDSVTGTSIPIQIYMTPNFQCHIVSRGGSKNNSGYKGLRHVSFTLPIPNGFSPYLS